MSSNFKPIKCFYLILLHPNSILVHCSKIRLRFHTPVFRSNFVKFECFLHILFYTVSFSIHLTEIIICISKTLSGR